MSNVISLSGGVDSTALTLRLLELGEEVVDIIFFDTGWEFPGLYDHLDKLEAYIGRKITRLAPRLPMGVVTDKAPFDWMFSEYPVKRRTTGEIRMIGRGWGAPRRRWCTGRKQEALDMHSRSLTYRQSATFPLYQCIGFTAEETYRVKECSKSDYIISRFPLIEWGWNKQDCLTYCKERGFDWGGLYDIFDRVSCFCCILQKVDDLRKLRRHYPGLWQRMIEMESWLPEGCKGRRFKDEKTVSDFEARFAAEDAHEARKILLPGLVCNETR